MDPQIVQVAASVDQITLVPQLPQMQQVAVSAGGDGVSTVFVVLAFMALAVFAIGVAWVFSAIKQARTEAIQENNNRRDQDREIDSLRREVAKDNTDERIARAISTALSAHK